MAATTRIYPRACLKCRAHRGRSALGTTGCNSRDLRDPRGPASFRNLEIVKGPDLADPGRGLFVWPGRDQHGMSTTGCTSHRHGGVAKTAPPRWRSWALRASRSRGRIFLQRIAEAKQLDAVLDLVGNSTILDSPRHVAPRRARVPRGLAGRARAPSRISPPPCKCLAVVLFHLLRQLRVRHHRVFLLSDVPLPGNRAAGCGMASSRP